MTESLSLRLNEVEPYPSGIRPLPTTVSGTAFFPGGSGLWREGGTTPDPRGGVLFLANDLEAQTEYQGLVDRGKEDLHDPVWRNLLHLMELADLRPEQCFFTCYFMGIRAEDRRSGPYPGAADPGYVSRCGHFLMRQLAEIRPRAIFTLGSYVPGLLGPLSPQLTNWSGIRGLTRLDAESSPLVHQAHFPEAGVTANVAALTHPSLHKADVHRRVYRDTTGHSAEVLLMLDALAAS